MDRKRMLQSLDEDIREHIARETQDNIDRGMPPEDARSAALRKFGNITKVREDTRAVWSALWLENLLQDVRYGIRMLYKSPGFTVVAVVVLALGIGANTALFSVVNGVLLRPLPYRAPDDLVILSLINTRTQEVFPLCDADFLDWRAQNQSFAAVAAFSGSRFNLTGSGIPEQIYGDVVTAGFFSVFGVTPALGRTFLPNEDLPGTPNMVVLSHRLWQTRYGSSAGVIGQYVTLNGSNHMIVGVMPPGFRPDPEALLWTNLTIAPPARRGPYYLNGEARLKPGVTMEQARMEVATIAERIKQQSPTTNTNTTFRIMRLDDAVVGRVRPALLVLLGAVAFVLLIASANVANLVLARSSVREREFAIRTALGAGRVRLAIQLITESVLLALLGGLFGLALAFGGVKLLLALGPASLPRLDEVTIDGHVLAFTAAVSLASGLLFGLVPLVGSGHGAMSNSLKEGGRSPVPSRRSGRARSVLVVAEIALSLVLLVGGGLMLKSFYRLQNVNPGVNTENALTLLISVPERQYDGPRTISFYRRLLEKVHALPGVESAAVGLSLPPNLLQITDYFMVEGQAETSERNLGLTDLVFVSPDYFRALGVPLIVGRSFTVSDRADAPMVVIINQTLARRYWPNQNPVGKRLKLGGSERPKNPWMEIVGVVGDVKYSGLDAPADMALYQPYEQAPWPSLYLVTRPSAKLADPGTLASAVQNAIWSLDKDVPIAQVRTLEQLLSESVEQPRFRTILLEIFAFIALSLAAVGIYGVLAYSVTQRRQEIGIRMALGAKRRDVFALVIGEGMLLTTVGVGFGLTGAFVLARFLSSLLYGVRPTDPATFAVVSLLLVGVAFLSCYIPARRAMRVDPLVALRYE